MVKYDLQSVPFENIPQLAHRDVAYQTEDERLSAFITDFPSTAAFQKLMQTRSYDHIDRTLLVSEIERQYESIGLEAKQKDNLQKLAQDNSYTVITAHQPSLLTGPLYYIIKICSVLSLQKQLSAVDANHEIVPLFVMGGEDHDFEEISSVNLFGKTYRWDRDAKGAVGRLSTDGLAALLDAVKETFGTMPYAEQLATLIDEAYANSNQYGEFMFRLTNSLFKQYGLLVVSMDNTAMKRRFQEVMWQDITQQICLDPVQEDQKRLEELGFKAQAFVRKINLFYHGQDRERIIKNQDDTYSIGDSQYTANELKEILHKSPEAFSPNVVLRPVYQEMIFPNLAYIGGGGELAYWMERKQLFDTLGIPFPLLVRRDSMLIVDRRSKKWLDENKVSIIDLFQRREQLINNFTAAMSTVEIDLSDAKKDAEAIFESIAALSKKVDPTLAKTTMAESTKVIKSIERLEGKLLKAEKSNYENVINKLRKYKDKFFPNNDSLQERHDNFIPFYLKHGPQWIEEMIDKADPLDRNFKILVAQ